MADDIRNEFINILRGVTWMNDDTRRKSIKKIDSMKTHIGYLNELTDNDKIEEFYKHLDIEPDSYLSNKLRLNIFKTDNNLNRLRKPVNKTDWTIHLTPVLVDAIYVPAENSIGAAR